MVFVLLMLGVLIVFAQTSAVTRSSMHCSSL